MIQQGYKCVGLSLWPCLMSCEQKMTKIWNQINGEDWKSVSDAMSEQTFLQHSRCVASILNFNGLCRKLTEIALFIYLI